MMTLSSFFRILLISSLLAVKWVGISGNGLLRKRTGVENNEADMTCLSLFFESGMPREEGGAAADVLSDNDMSSVKRSMANGVAEGRKVYLVGHASSDGDETSNMELSKRRVAWAAHHLNLLDASHVFVPTEPDKLPGACETVRFGVACGEMDADDANEKWSRRVDVVLGPRPVTCHEFAEYNWGCEVHPGSGERTCVDETDCKRTCCVVHTCPQFVNYFGCPHARPRVKPVDHFNMFCSMHGSDACSHTCCEKLSSIVPGGNGLTMNSNGPRVHNLPENTATFSADRCENRVSMSCVEWCKSTCRMRYPPLSALNLPTKGGGFPLNKCYWKCDYGCSRNIFGRCMDNGRPWILEPAKCKQHCG